VPDERPWSVAAHSQIDGAPSESQQVTSARHAAEALFKPRHLPGPTERPLTSSDTPTSELQCLRKPRILMSSAAAPDSCSEPEELATSPDERQGAATTEGAAKIPTSEYRRVRILANYGMTPKQVAELYEASLSEVKRIIGKREAPATAAS
jgi:hypothetical protein